MTQPGKFELKDVIKAVEELEAACKRTPQVGDVWRYVGIEHMPAQPYRAGQLRRTLTAILLDKGGHAECDLWTLVDRLREYDPELLPVLIRIARGERPKKVAK